jgi:ribonuclease H / adenosylcobalamin/alpha-ribazole phosphatase
MQKTIIYLIRHSTTTRPERDGQALMYGPEAELTEAGVHKAEKLGQALLAREGRPFDVIVSSPYRRAMQTAQIVAEQMGFTGQIALDPRLQDTASSWAGVPAEELGQVYSAGRLFDDPRTHETLAQMAARMAAAYDEIYHAHLGKQVAIFSHGDPLRVLAYHVLHPGEDLPPYQTIIRALSLDTAEALRIAYSPDGVVESEVFPPRDAL